MTTWTSRTSFADAVAQLSTGRGFPDLRVHEGRWADHDRCPPVRCVVTDARWGGSQGHYARGNVAEHVGDCPDAVAANRASLARSLGVSDVANLAIIAAAHGADVAWVDEPGTIRNVDALVTNRVGLGLVALGADCAVIGLRGHTGDGDPLVAVAHCGWRGLVSDVTGAVVDEMRSRGAMRIEAIIGPAICGTCYVVGAERQQEVRDSCSTRVAEATCTTTGLDIGAGVREALIEQDVQVAHIFGCTFESDSWFSLRRACSQATGEAVTGRHALALVIR